MKPRHLFSRGCLLICCIAAAATLCALCFNLNSLLQMQVSIPSIAALARSKPATLVKGSFGNANPSTAAIFSSAKRRLFSTEASGNGTDNMSLIVSPSHEVFWQTLRRLSTRNFETGPIIIQVNSAMVDLALNLHCSLKAAGDFGVLFWSSDHEAHSKLTDAGLLSFFDPKEFTVVLGRQYYHEGNYNQMMRDRAKFWQLVMKAGVGFWWMDADMVVRKDFRKLLHPHADLNIQIDAWAYVDWKVHSHWSWGPQGCGGFFHVNSTTGGNLFIDGIAKVLNDQPDKEDQQALNIVMYDQNVSTIINHYAGSPSRRRHAIERYKHLLKAQFFSQLDIINGHIYWPKEGDPKSTFPGWNDNRFAVVHANGVADKHAAFKQSGFWMLDDDNQSCKQG